MDTNLFISIIIRTFSVGVVAFFIIPKMIAEVARPKSQFTRLRWIVLLLFVISAMTAVPVLVYQYMALFERPSQQLASLVGVVSSVGGLANTILLLMLFTYRYQEDSIEDEE